MTDTLAVLWERTGPDIRAPFHPRHVHHFDRDRPAALTAAENTVTRWTDEARADGYAVAYVTGASLAACIDSAGTIARLITYTETDDPDATRWDARAIGVFAAMTEHVPTLRALRGVTPEQRRN